MPRVRADVDLARISCKRISVVFNNTNSSHVVYHIFFHFSSSVHMYTRSINLVQCR